MRGYTVTTAALALDVDHKWLDNLLSQHSVPGVTRVQRGVRRRLPPRSISIIALARALHAEMSVPVHRALEIAVGIIDSSTPGHPLGDFLSLHLDRDGFVADVNRRLDDAAEVAAVPLRGRRPRAASGSGP